MSTKAESLQAKSDILVPQGLLLAVVSLQQEVTPHLSPLSVNRWGKKNALSPAFLFILKLLYITGFEKELMNWYIETKWTNEIILKGF